MRQTMTMDAAYEHYLAEVVRLKSKYAVDRDDFNRNTPLVRTAFDTAYVAQVNAALSKGSHHPGTARIAERLARATAYDFSNKQANAWQKLLRQMGSSSIPSYGELRFHGMPKELADAIDYVKNNNVGLNPLALSHVIATQIFGSL